VGGETIASDSAFSDWMVTHGWVHYAAAVLGAGLVLGLGAVLAKRKALSVA